MSKFFLNNHAFQNIIQSKMKLSLFLLILGFILFLSAKASIQFVHYQEKLESSEQWAHQKTIEIARDLDTKILKLESVTLKLKRQVENSECPGCELEHTLKSLTTHTHLVKNLGVAFAPGRAQNGMRLYAPFIRVNSDSLSLGRVDRDYDYTLNPESWFHQGMAEPQQWLGPIYDPSIQKYVLRYTLPIVVAGDTLGLAYSDLNLAWFEQHLDLYDIKDNNYIILTNRLQQEFYHSLKDRSELVRNYTSTSQHVSLYDIEHKVIKNSLTQVESWFHSQRVGHTPLYLQTIVGQDSELLDLINEKERTYWIVSLVVLFLMIYTLWKYSRRRTRVRELVFDSFAYTLIFFVGMTAIWYVQMNSSHYTPEVKEILANSAQIKSFKDKNSLLALENHQESPQFIPIGLFVQSLEFINATNVNLTGYLWHRYPEGEFSDFDQGTIFPEAISTNMKLQQTDTVDAEVIKVWYFETTLRENFDPSQFPFDKQSVWVRLWHQKLNSNIIFIPDIKGYNSLNTRSLPGIENDFVLSGWNLYRSYFDAKLNHYNMSFGRKAHNVELMSPELYFNIEIVRSFLNPFISHLFPLLVVFLMLFAIVITASQKGKMMDILGFNVSTVVASASALFFVALIAHVQLRGELAANKVVYLEYFYLISYVYILLITVNSILFSLKVPMKFIQFHDNLMPKLFYWPVLFGVLFIVSISVF